MTRLIFCLTNGLALLSLGHCLSVGRYVDDIGRTSCSFDLDQREGDINPMIIDHDNHIIYPSDSRVMTFADGSEFGLFCHSSEKRANQLILSNGGQDYDNFGDYALIECVGGNFMAKKGDPGDIKIDILASTCANRMEPRISKDFSSHGACADTGADGRKDDLDDHLHIVHIGFQIRDTFHIQIELCTDEKSYGTLWTKHQIQGLFINENDRNERPSFKADTYRERRFFNFTSSTALDKMYVSSSEASAIEDVLGTDTLPDGEEIVVVNSGTRSFNRGHISPDADFVMDYEQDATYYFLNVAPQYGSFNQKNWLYTESASRDKSHTLAKTTQVISGTWGQLQYPNTAEEPTSLFLDPKGEKAPVIPIPAYYWKILYDDQERKAVAFLGMNDIYSPDVTETLCPSVCDKLDWVDFDVEDESLGHITCCDMESFAKVVSFAPDLRECDGKWPELML